MLVVESTDPVAFTAADEATLTVVASIVASAVEAERSRDRTEPRRGRRRPRADRRPRPEGPVDAVRFFEVDGSTFLDGDYLIKGVAGRILWALLGHHDREGRVDFTNREMRLDPTLDLPALSRQLREPLDPAEAAPRRARRADPHRQDEPWCFRLVIDGPVALETG